MTISPPTVDETVAVDPGAHPGGGAGKSIGTPAKGRVMKFTYPSGAAPLDGYTIRRGVGLGGFGEVYFATSGAGKEVALKRVQRNLDIELRGVSQCLNLKHPNLVDLYDIRYDDSGDAWVVMEFVNGHSLRDEIDDHPTGMAHEDVLNWFGGLAAGTAYLHQCGLVHRDLKPGNIFEDGGIVKIGDYGLSKFISSSRRGGQTESVGTFHYMAPEVGRGEYGKEIDIYALGIILHEMVTGRVPFDGESSHEIVMKHLTAQPDLDACPEPYRSVVAKALEKDPGARHPSVEHMLRPLGLRLDAHGIAGPLDSGASAEPFYVARLAETGETAAAAATADRNDGTEKEESRVQLNHVPIDEGEPIARAVRSSLTNLNEWWNGLQLTSGGRVVLVLLGAFFLVANSNWLLPLLALFGVIYVPYYVIRLLVLGAATPSSYAQAHAKAVAEQRQRSVQQPISYRQWCSKTRHELGSKPYTERGAELFSGLTISLLTAGLLTSVAGMVGLREGPLTAVAIAPFAMAGIVGVVGSMLLLSFGKLWEAHEAGTGPRRLLLFGVGMVLGAIAFQVNQFLMIDPAAVMADPWAGEPSHSVFPVLYQDGAPTRAAYMVYFGLLFAALRWWRTVDPLRTNRLSLWSAAVATVMAWALNVVVPIGGPWVLLAACTMAISTQSAAPWENPKNRFSREAIA